jgi:hypothetical protein
VQIWKLEGNSGNSSANLETGGQFRKLKCKSGNSSANQKLKVKSRNLSVNLETSFQICTSVSWIALKFPDLHLGFLVSLKFPYSLFSFQICTWLSSFLICRNWGENPWGNLKTRGKIRKFEVNSWPGVLSYLIKFVSDLWQVSGFLWVLRFPVISILM